MSNNTITLRDFLNYCDRPHNLSNFINTDHNEHALPAQIHPVEFLTPTQAASAGDMKVTEDCYLT